MPGDRYGLIGLRERAKLLGVPALQIGKVGGDKLTIKVGVAKEETSNTAFGDFQVISPEQEFLVLLTELHDAWWNSIARALA